MRHPTPLRPGFGRARAFTLIEMLIASVIMAITIAAVAVVMRTGLRAWRIGHAATEIFQTARIAQDTVVRDLDNMVFLDDLAYNRNFTAQLKNLAQTYAANPDLMKDFGRPKRHKPQTDRGNEPPGKYGAAQPQNPLDLENIAPPIDLSFNGTNNDKLDRLSFARGYLPRFDGDQPTWGLRRVRYYVRNGILYRREDDPFGLSQGALNAATQPTAPRFLKSGYPQDDPMALQNAMLMDLAKMFMLPDESGMNATELSQPPPETAETDAMKPTAVEVEEPLCAGVEIFDISYGYFKGGEWLEVKDWHSAGHQYRNPPVDEGNTDALGNGRNGVLQSGQQGNAVNPFQPQLPDDLPGYIAIQLGIRIPEEKAVPAEGDQPTEKPKEKPKGKLYSFTFYHSLPEGQETDVDQTDNIPGR
jgi:prepilin-type N-terminal cleavage/methylation domain-containing protein